MKKTDVLVILETIKNYYPNRFQYDDRLANFWTEAMKGMDNDLVKKRLISHVRENKFPPTISEISAYPKVDDKQLKKLERLKQDAEEVPQYIKDEFREKMAELVRGKKNE